MSGAKPLLSLIWLHGVNRVNVHNNNNNNNNNNNHVAPVLSKGATCQFGLN
jgi:hypothetical protein